MKLNLKHLAVGLALTGGIAGNALAAGTTAGTDIENIATLTFDTATTTGIIVESSPTGNSDTGTGNGEDTIFEVDRKLDIEVVQQDATLVQAAPGDTAVLEFLVTNNGNDVQDVSLAALAFATSGTDPDVTAAQAGTDDDFNGTGVIVVVESGATAGYQAGEDTVTYIDELAADDDIVVYIVATMPGGGAVDNGDAALYSLQATVGDGGAASIEGTASVEDTDGDDPTEVENVFADAAGSGSDGAGTGDVAYDGIHSDAWAFIIVKAEVTITKEAIAVWDPFTCDDDADPSTDPTPPTTHDVSAECGTGNPLAVPGAYVEYTITIENAANAATATNLSISDVVDDAEVTFVADAYTDDDALTCGLGGNCGIYVVQPYTGAEPAGEAHTNNGGFGDADSSSFAGGTVTSAPDDLPGGQTTKIKFRVLIQ